MRKISKPTIDLVDHFEVCFSGVADLDLYERLQGIRNDLCVDSENFDTFAQTGSLHLFTRKQSKPPVSDAELEELYVDQMSKGGGSARLAYSSLLNGAPNKICPHCGINIASTLDHHLPKKQYPGLTISPWNLVPCCGDCNKAKGTRYPRGPEDQIFHPYYDDCTQTKWVEANIIQSDPIVIDYFVAKDPVLPQLFQKRAEKHFQVFKLSMLYSLNAADELVSMRRLICETFKGHGPDGIKQFALEKAESYQLRPNSWQHSLYISLAKDIWFLNGGFNHIAAPL